MKKIIMPLLVICLLLTTTLAYTVIVRVKGIELNVTREVGDEIELIPKLGEITGWEVKEGNVTIENNKFIMPEENVEIEAITQTQKYQLVIETPFITRNEEKEAGIEVTVTAGESDSYIFSNWTASGITLTDEQKVSKVITFTMPQNDVSLVANYTGVTYTISYNANGGIGAPEAQTKTHGTALTLSSTIPTKTGYTFLGWATTNTATVAEYQAGGSFTQDSNTTLYAVWKINWNNPVLGTGMTPVNWNGSTWVDTTEASWEYNYETASAWSSSNTVAGDGNAKWANARTSDGSMYVWIPRFTYYADAGDSVSWNADTAGTARTYIVFSNGTTDYTTDPTGNTTYTYSTHGAFSPGGIPITGFWIAKFEASRNDATDSSGGSGTTPASKPGVISWRSETVSDMFNYGKNLNITLGSHLLKDDEWGAVAYLTSAIGRIPYINNSSSYITGNAGDTQDASSASGVTNAWNTIKGVRASTTHNIYGVYDLSGGVWEYTSAYYSGYSDSSCISNLINSNTSDGNKYVNLYTTTSPTGDNARIGWDSDYSYSLGSGNPVAVRGGNDDNTSSAGVFYFHDGSGYSRSYYGFRLALWGCGL